MEFYSSIDGYTGLLLMQCEECGEVRGYNAKTPVLVHRCYNCGHKTPIRTIRKAYLSCECGYQKRYITNVTDNEVTAKCGSFVGDKIGTYCNYPIDLVWNPQKRIYETYETMDKRRKKMIRKGKKRAVR